MLYQINSWPYKNHPLLLQVQARTLQVQAMTLQVQAMTLQVHSEEAANTNCIVFGLIRTGLELTILKKDIEVKMKLVYKSTQYIYCC
jgi:hypothetical protein